MDATGSLGLGLTRDPEFLANFEFVRADATGGFDFGDGGFVTESEGVEGIAGFDGVGERA